LALLITNCKYKQSKWNENIHDVTLLLRCIYNIFL